MNSRDMCMIDHVGELMDAGLDSLKIEGRAKSPITPPSSPEPTATPSTPPGAGMPLDPVWRDEVEHISHRHYSTGFFYGQPGQFTRDSRYIRDWQICAVVTDCDADGLATLSLRNKFAAGDHGGDRGAGYQALYRYRSGDARHRGRRADGAENAPRWCSPCSCPVPCRP